MVAPTIYGGLRAYYKFEETIGQPAIDSAANGSEGVFTNASQVVGGKLGAQGMRTSLATGKMVVPSNPYLNATSLISVSVWAFLDMALDAMWGTPIFMDKRGGLTSGYFLGVATPGTKDVTFRVFNSAGTPYSATFTETATTGWIHYVGVYEGALVKLYRNGTLVASVAADGTQRFNHAADLDSIGLGFQGVLDELQVWDFQLTAANVTTLYNAGNGLDIIFPQGFGLDLPDESAQFFPTEIIVDLNTPALPTAVDFDDFLVPAFPGISPELTDLGSIFAPYTVKDAPKIDFIDPVPSVVSITVNGSHQVTATGNGGPTDAGLIATWWEIYLTTGEVVVTADRMTGQTFVTDHNQVDSFPVPLGQSWNGLEAKFWMQAVDDGSQIWSSPAFVLNDPNFNNPVPVVVPTFTDPLPQIVSVDLDGAYNVHVVGKVGPSTSPNVVTWWEVELTTGEFVAVIDREFPVDVSTIQQTVTDVFLIPQGINLQGKSLRLVAQAEFDTDQRWYSAPYLLTDAAYNRSVYVPAPLNPLGPITAAAKPTPNGIGPGVYSPSTLDFSTRR